jgi:cytidylate kinase
MPVVTIRGQMGSGVQDIGQEIARQLPGDYVDKEILESIAQLVGHPLDRVAEIERAPLKLVQRIKAVLEGAKARSGSLESAYSRTWKEPLDDAKYLDALESVIQDLALEGNIVLHGRGSQFILRNNPSAFHVLIVAPLPYRIKRVMNTLRLSEEDARERIEEYDESRKAFIQRFFERDIENPEYYDLVVNTEHLDHETVGHIIVKGAQRKTPWGHI